MVKKLLVALVRVRGETGRAEVGIGSGLLGVGGTVGTVGVTRDQSAERRSAVGCQMG
jgi:hypothetical protein